MIRELDDARLKCTIERKLAIYATVDSASKKVFEKELDILFRGCLPCVVRVSKYVYVYRQSGYTNEPHHRARVICIDESENYLAKKLSDTEKNIELFDKSYFSENTYIDISRSLDIPNYLNELRNSISVVDRVLDIDTNINLESPRDVINKTHSCIRIKTRHCCISKRSLFKSHLIDIDRRVEDHSSSLSMDIYRIKYMTLISLARILTDYNGKDFNEYLDLDNINILFGEYVDKDSVSVRRIYESIRRNKAVITLELCSDRRKSNMDNDFSKILSLSENPYRIIEYLSDFRALRNSYIVNFCANESIYNVIYSKRQSGYRILFAFKDKKLVDTEEIKDIFTLYI